ncbi:NAD-dependent epimerase/dehydratase family protein [Vibrio sp. WXL103]|uniref:NAD-dependent epimerase/dehydratase family protein n=1 Tax=Vibrio sp. WXL103 TaxID=3450710 RepID=UPI003EC90625
MKIVVIGGGWLGVPLAGELEKSGHTVVISKTAPEGVKTLNNLGLRAELVSLGSDSTPAIIERLKPYSPEIVIGCFPPGFRAAQADIQSASYQQKWQQLTEIAEHLGVNKLVMISTTGVYPSADKAMTEESVALGDSDLSDKSRKLLEAEQCVLESAVPATVLRCSGLFGPERHPARFVRHMKSVSDSAPANMVHLVDVIGAIQFLLTRGEQQIFNVTTPNTVSKAMFYQHAIGTLSQTSQPSLTLPSINHHPDKLIVSDKLVQHGYRFHYQHVYEALDSL